jgi:simple sugar transport system permease protein
MRRILHRPEFGAACGVIAIWLFFSLYAGGSGFLSRAGSASYLEIASELGILATAVSLLMIAGEFDLSVGSMIAASGMTISLLCEQLGWSIWAGIAVAMALSLVVGFANGVVVVRTGLPSFIVTLGSLFILRGLSLVGLKWASGGSTQLRGINDAAGEGFFREIFSGVALEGLFRFLADADLIDKFPNGVPKVDGVPVSVLWFVAMAALATWILLRTRIGNWIFAAGGDANAARNSGVPVDRVKTGLFMATAAAAALVAVLTVLDAGSTDARRGFQKEFEAIIAAVIGGCLLTGGYGSAVGAFLGAIIFGMVSIGLTYTRFDSDWFQVFLGGMLLLAVVFNNFIRKKVTGER